MSEPTWVVTENDRYIARFGLMQQISINGLEDHFRCVEFEDFLENQVEVIASWAAQARFLQNIIHEQMKESANREER